MHATELMTNLHEITGLQVRTVSDQATVALAPAKQVMALRDGLDEFVVEGDAYLNALKYVGFSKAMANRLSAQTASMVATELIQNKGRSTALIRDGQLLSVVSKGRYKALPVDTVVETVESVLGEVDYHRALVIPPYGARLEIVGQREHEVVKGDIVRAGVVIDFNPIGLTNPMVSTYGLRLVCTNGMTANTVFDTYMMTEDVVDTRAWMAQTVSDAYESLDDTVQEWRSMAGFTVSPSDRSLLLGGFIKDARLTGKEQTALLSKATDETPETAFDVLNLLTWLSSHVIQDPTRVRRAQNVAARFIEDEVYHRNCPTCKRAGK